MLVRRAWSCSCQTVKILPATGTMPSARLRYLTFSQGCGELRSDRHGSSTLLAAGPSYASKLLDSDI